MPDSPTMPFTPQEALEFMQRMWNPFGMQVPGLSPPPAPGVAPPSMPFPNPAAMFATLDPVEIDRKIAELRVIENWLAMSQNFMQMSIKTLELQKASLEALRAGTRAAGASEPPRRKSKSSSGEK
jgi:hypothetical protein